MPRQSQRRQEAQAEFDLLGSEDTYSGQNAQNPVTSRKVQSWISSEDGELHREEAEPLFINQALTGPIVALYNFNQNNASGIVQRFYFAVARVSSSFDPNTPDFTCNLYISVGGSWTLVSDVSVLVDVPAFKTINNLLFVSDGVTNWMFDGTSWVHVGISIPFQGGFDRVNKFSGPPFWQPAIDNTAAGTFTATIGRYYWFTNSDQTSTRPVHEGDSSAISDSTGVVANKKITIYQTPGLWSVTNGSKEITVSASADSPGPVLPLDSVSPDAGSGPATLSEAFKGLTLYINGILIGVIAGVALNGGGANVLVLEDNSASTIVDGRPVIVDARCTHWNIYASESDGSKVGYFLNQSIPVTQDLSSTPATDQSPFIDDPDNTFVPTFRPVRNDQPPPSRILEVHKVRLWRVRKAAPNLFDFTANEEVASGVNGNPVECVPGATQSYVSSGAAQETNVQQIAGTGVSEAGPYWAWVNPTNVTSAVSYATATAPLPQPFVSSNILLAKQFGFSIPASATILGIQVDLEALTSRSINIEGDGEDRIEVYMRKASSGLNYGFHFIHFPTETNAPYTLGDDTDLWSTSWTPADINDANFGVTFNDVGSSATHGWTTSIRNVRIKIYYLAATSGGGTSETIINTISDIVNESSFPDQSNRIRGLVSHGDALYMGSERQVYPLYGESLNDFALSQVTAFNVGFFGRDSSKSTPHGLAFLSYDRKLLLYPNSAVPSTNATDSLIEIGKPMRNKFKAMNTQWNLPITEMYYYGIRNWFVIGFPDATGAFQTYVFDFSMGAWYQLQRGFTSLAVFEIGDGQLILVGGAENGNVYVIDDQTGTYTTSSALPVATWRPALISFGNQAGARVLRYLEIELSSNDLFSDLTFTYWLDPEDVDNPGTGQTLTMSKINQIGTNFYRGWFQGGATCKRLLLEIAAASSANSGRIRGIKLVANPYAGLLP